MAKKKAFSFKMAMDDGAVRITLSGPFDESVELPELDRCEKVFINCRAITSINSAGSRIWSHWLRGFALPTQIFLEECPVTIVKAMSMIRGFLPVNAIVNSFYIPFYSEVTGESATLLAIRDKHFLAGGQLKLPVLKDSKGNVLEMDVIPTAYFAFLNR